MFSICFDGSSSEEGWLGEKWFKPLACMAVLQLDTAPAALKNKLTGASSGNFQCIWVCVVYICMHFSVCMVNQSFSDIKFFPTFLLFFSQNQASWTTVRCFGLNRKVSPTFSKHKRTVWASPQAPYLCSDNLKTLGTQNLWKISCSTWSLETPWAFFSFF